MLRLYIHVRHKNVYRIRRRVRNFQKEYRRDGIFSNLPNLDR